MLTWGLRKVINNNDVDIGGGADDDDKDDDNNKANANRPLFFACLFCEQEHHYFIWGTWEETLNVRKIFNDLTTESRE